jgi:rhodanese-related sulfurtransferase
MFRRLQNYLFKNIIIGVIILVLTMGLSGCGLQENAVQEVLSDDEINQILADVIGGEEVLIDNAKEYFNGLSSENRNMITPEELQKIITDQTDGYVLIDIRSAEDYGKGHIKGAKNIFWFDIGDHLDELPKDQRIFMTCYSGQSAGQVVGVLKVLGYDIVSLAGGMNGGWLAKELPITTE